MINYVLNDKGITFFVDGIIVFDCPAARMQQEPIAGVRALQMVEDFWKRKVETLKGGDMQ